MALALVCAASSVVVNATAGSAATPSSSYPYVMVREPEAPTGGWGERLASARLPGAPVATGDYDNDGVGDFFVGQPGVERVYLYSGKTRQMLSELRSPQPQSGARFGFFIAVLGDVNGDGKADIAVGTDNFHVGSNQSQGRAWVFSGATSTALYAVDKPVNEAFARFGSRLGRAGDVNGDGVAELIAGASSADVPAACGQQSPVPDGCRVNQGQAYLFNGRNGALIRTLDLPAEDKIPATCTSGCGTFGLAVQGPGDVSGDGVADQLVGAPSLQVGANSGQGRMYLFSGTNGALLARIDDPVPQVNATFGFQDGAPLSPGDVNNDGIADLYGNGFQQNGETGLEYTGRAWVFDGKATVANKAGRTLYEVKNPKPKKGGQFGWSMATTDYDRDGRPDIYVGSAPHHLPGTTDMSGGTYVFRGRDGAHLKALELSSTDAELGGPDYGSELGWSLAAPGDLNADCEPDYLGGAPHHDVDGIVDNGAVLAFQSQAPARSRCPIADFAGNGNTDVAFFRKSGTWFVHKDPNFPVSYGNQPGDIPVPGDYNGDGSSDVAIFRAGTWFIRNQPTVTFGTIQGDIPVPADYNGDKRTDIAIFRPSTGQWFVQNQFTVTYGTQTGDVPIPGDYNGDGKTDVAIFRKGGFWLVKDQFSVPYGSQDGDVPVPGDYNGDGKTDVAIFRKGGGWFVKDQLSVTYGSQTGDIPIPGDYNGDGTTDVAIRRPSTGQWYVRNNPNFPVTYGSGTGDIPLQMPYAIRRVFFPTL